MAQNTIVNYVNKTSTTYDIKGELTQNKFSNKDAIESIVIGDTVTSIGRRAFYTFSNLLTITIPNTVKSIGEEAFRGCGELKRVNIPDSVTKIEPKTFYNCTSLTYVTVSANMSGFGEDAFGNVPTQGTLYCNQNWYNGLSTTNITNLGNVYNWTKSYTMPNVIFSSVTQTSYNCVNYNYTKQDLITTYTGYSSTSLVEYNVETVSTIIEENSKLCGYIPYEDRITKYYLRNGEVEEYDIQGSLKGPYSEESTCHIEELVIGKSVTGISSFSFYGEMCLKKVTIPDTVQGIGSWCFDNIPSSGDLYCTKRWFDKLSPSDYDNLQNLKSWRIHFIEEDPPRQRQICFETEKQQINLLNCNKIDQWIDTCITRKGKFKEVVNILG